MVGASYDLCTMAGKPTLVLGATERKDRFANLAIRKLRDHGHEVVAVGNRTGNVDGIPIHTDISPELDIDTVTLYLNPYNQAVWRERILALKPKRIIFNPGTENMELQAEAIENDIEPVIGCTLVMLSLGNY
jgi:uncharacterized protein